jgi:YVTN family beta-propeller protein
MHRVALTAAIAVALTAAAGASSVRIIQTNSAGTTVSIIDPATNKVVGVINGIEVNHGAASAPDGSKFYISNEADKTLDVVDAKTLKVIKHIPLTAHPNNIDISHDGKRVYVSIAAAPGAVDVIDTTTLTKAKTLPVKGAAHNTYVTPDGKFVVTGSVAGKRVTVFDQPTEKELWTMDFDAGVRPIAFEKNADGSVKRMFVQLSDFHGFVAVDWATHKEVARVTLPDIPEKERETEGLQGSPSHGMVIPADGKTIWVTSKLNSRLYEYSLPDLKLMGEVKVGGHPEWLTATPDGKTIYSAGASVNAVSVVDVATRKEITRIPVGYVPKRNITAVLP